MSKNGLSTFRRRMLLGLVSVSLFCILVGLTHRRRAQTKPSSSFYSSQIPIASPQRLLLNSLSDEDFNNCIQTLELVARDNEKVGKDEFILFLELYSDRTLEFEDFKDIPTAFVLIFYTAACSFGGGCRTEEETTISLKHVGGAQGVLHMFCQSVKEVATVQISFDFQFQVRYIGEDNYSAIELIPSGSEGDKIRATLEQITEEVLLDTFGCQTGPLRGLVHDDLHGIDPVSCDYKVNAEIKEIFPSVCLPQSASDLEIDVNTKECAIVSTRVSVTVASLHYDRTRSELRNNVIEALKVALTRDQIQERF